MAFDDRSWRVRLTELLDDYRRRDRPVTSGERLQAAIDWQSELVDAHLAAPGWPASVGGMELDLADQLDYYRMITAAGAPRHPCNPAFIVAPTLIVHGTPEQRDRFLDPLLRAQEIWCQGFSEPAAGSDLASLTTRAVRDGDVYRVTGQKVWTTMADRADWMFALVRTGPSGRSTAGITYLLIDMRSPGIDVQPLRDASGGRHFAEVFFDDVEVPVENRVGDEGDGWSIMRTSLGHERATAFLADEFRYRTTVDRVVRLALERGYRDDRVVRSELAELETSVHTIAYNSARALDAVLRGEDPGGVASVNRLVKSEFEQRLHSLALRLTGPGAVLGSRSVGAVDGGRWTYGYLMSRATTIGAGTSEIQRNTIAETVLGLPSSRGENRRPAAVPPGRPLATPDTDETAVRGAIGEALASRSGAADTWEALVEFGLPGLAVPESLGGGGASPRLLLAAVEEAGRRLASAPLVPTVAALAVVVECGAEDAVRAIAAGARAVVATPADDAGWRIGDASPTLDGSRVSGRVDAVTWAPVADLVVVIARDVGTDEPAVAVVRAVDVVVDPQEPLDLTSEIGSITFGAAAAEVVARGDDALRAVAAGERAMLSALAADSVGVAGRAVSMAVDWAGQREQFGRLIGSFQAVSHRCADMLVDTEGARNLVLGAGEGTDVDLAAAYALSAAVRVAQSCVQVHGGIGFTWEHPAHLLLRRALANEARCARPDALRDRAAVTLLQSRRPAR